MIQSNLHTDIQIFLWNINLPNEHRHRSLQLSVNNVATMEQTSWAHDEIQMKDDIRCNVCYK